MFGFGAKPDPKQTVRDTERSTRKAQRDMDRDASELLRLEKQLEGQIKDAAKKGKKDLVAVYAKQLVQVRKQHVRTVQLNTKVGTISTSAKLAYSNQKMAETMGDTTKAIGKMNAAMDPMKTAAMVKSFGEAMTMADMKEEMLDDMLESVLDDGDEEAEDEVVKQVLDEIGIDLNAKMPSAPISAKQPVAAASSDTDDPLLERLEKLKGQ